MIPSPQQLAYATTCLAAMFLRDGDMFSVHTHQPSFPPQLYMPAAPRLPQALRTPPISAQTHANSSARHHFYAGVRIGRLSLCLWADTGTPTQHGPAPTVSMPELSVVSLRGHEWWQEPPFHRTEPNHGKTRADLTSCVARITQHEKRPELPC